MQDLVSFGDEIVFGNFITLVRSNYEWYSELKAAVDLFGKIHRIYEDVLEEFGDGSSLHFCQ